MKSYIPNAKHYKKRTSTWKRKYFKQRYPDWILLEFLSEKVKKKSPKKNIRRAGEELWLPFWKLQQRVCLNFSPEFAHEKKAQCWNKKRKGPVGCTSSSLFIGNYFKGYKIREITSIIFNKLTSKLSRGTCFLTYRLTKKRKFKDLLNTRMKDHLLMMIPKRKKTKVFGRNKLMKNGVDNWIYSFVWPLQYFFKWFLDDTISFLWISKTM